MFSRRKILNIFFYLIDKIFIFSPLLFIIILLVKFILFFFCSNIYYYCYFFLVLLLFLYLLLLTFVVSVALTSSLFFILRLVFCYKLLLICCILYSYLRNLHMKKSNLTFFAFNIFFSSKTHLSILIYYDQNKIYLESFIYKTFFFLPSPNT